MLWPVPDSRDFPLLLLLPCIFGVDAGRLYVVLPDRLVGKQAARHRNPQSGYMKAKSSIQVLVVVVRFWCSRNPQPGYLTSPIQVVILLLWRPFRWSSLLRLGKC